MWSAQTRQLVQMACREDLGARGDITSALLPNAQANAVGRIVARQTGVLCGMALVPEICAVFAEHLGAPLALGATAAPCTDGARVAAGTCVGTVCGSRGAVLGVERTLLNFLSRLSGIATLTRRFVDAAQARHPTVKIFDTRKTLPGWRELDKYAVRAGGGHNHRLGLYDAVLIKDNHLVDIPLPQLADALGQWLARRDPAARFVEVEVDSLVQLEEVCRVADVNVVLLDNFSVDQMRAAVALRDARGLRGRLELEASGGVTLARIGEIAATGVDRISVGALTHSAVALDIALDL